MSSSSQGSSSWFGVVVVGFWEVVTAATGSSSSHGSSIAGTVALYDPAAGAVAPYVLPAVP